MKRKILSTILILALTATSVTACGKSSSADKNKETLTVLNYGKYIDENAVKTFEDKVHIILLKPFWGQRYLLRIYLMCHFFANDDKISRKAYSVWMW